MKAKNVDFEMGFTRKAFWAFFAFEWLLSLKNRNLIRLDRFEILLMTAKLQIRKERPPYRVNSLVSFHILFTLERFKAMTTLKATCILMHQNHMVVSSLL